MLTEAILKPPLDPEPEAADVTRFVRQESKSPAGVLEPIQPLADGIGARFHLEARDGAGFREFIRVADDLFVVLVDTIAGADWHLKFVEEDFLTFHYRVSGVARESFDEYTLSEPDGPFCSVDLHPAQIEKTVWIPSGTHFRTVSIKTKPSFIFRTFGETPSWLPESQVAYLNGGAAELVSFRMPLTAAIRQATNELIDCPYTGGLRRAYVEAKAIELVCLTLDALAQRKNVATLPVRLRERDIESLRQAYAILAANFVDPPPVPRLARMVGLNRNKLAYGFKHIFGVTTTHFLQMQRMEQALKMLRTGQHNVSEVALAVGYNDPGGFTKIFKKHFGYLPKELLQEPATVPAA